MRMSPRLPHSAVFSLAAVIHLLLFSIVCPVSGRIYRTKDAVVMEVDDVVSSGHLLTNQPLTRFVRSDSSGNPPPPVGSFFEAENVTASTSSETRQQTIYCGEGPATPPQRTGEERIVGGNTAGKAWPFVVGIKTTLAYPVFCGGSIISENKILTAASCVERLSLKQIATMTVRLGMSDQGDGKENEHNARVTSRVTQAVYHIDFNRKTKQNDIAILTINPPIVYTSYVSPVCLPPASNAPTTYAGKTAAIMGWGQSSAGGNSARFLKEAGVKIMSNANCKNLWSDLIDFGKQQICASGDGKDICAGDIGGPLVAQVGTGGSPSWYQVGVDNFSYNCAANPKRPAVFSSVAFFRNWINTYMNN